MIYWQFLFLSNQRLAFLALFLDLLHQTGVTLKLRLPYGKRFLNMRFSTANMRELITEDQHTAAQLLQPLRNGGDSTSDQCNQLLDFCFQFPQQHIVGFDLPIHFTAVRDDSLALQCPRCHALMNGRDLVNTPCGIATVVNAFLPPGVFQTAIGHISPCRPPCRKLFLAVPALGDRILPAVPSTFGMLVSPDKPPFLGSRRCHIHLLFAELVRVLFLPALVLCCPEFGGSKTAFLTVFHAEVFLLGLVLPLALFIQWAHRQQNVSVGIVTVGVVDSSIGTHSV